MTLAYLDFLWLNEVGSQNIGPSKSAHVIIYNMSILSTTRGGDIWGNFLMHDDLMWVTKFNGSVMYAEGTKSEGLS